ncbi:hypothetical protein [Microbulbifer discodermiae]|uniref:hypothetical protein n=1 Tax=Microbulbifer sp. 2201CG32-9 TaxID=3232309 RepID=UPI00345B6CE4
MVVGGTTSELSGGKFANGAITAAMQYVMNWQGGGESAQKEQGNTLPGVFNDEKFRQQLDRALGYTGSAVRGVRELSGENATLGLVIRNDEGFTISPNYPNGLVPQGYENKGYGLLGTNFFYSSKEIQGAAAIAVSLPVGYRNESIIGASVRWNGVAASIGAPVVVRADRATSTWIFIGSGDPIPY